MLVDRDADLAIRTRRLIGGQHPFAAAHVTADDTVMSSDGAPLNADFEIGSISKGVTGMLYVDALERGEITEQTTLGDCLPFDDVAAAGVTLKSITIHRSGLPRLPAAAQPFRRSVRLWTRGANPYGETVDEIIAQAADVQVAKPTPRYSNFAFQLLGHALARAAGTTYPELIKERIARPLGVDVFYAPADPTHLRPEALIGTTRRGRTREPWTGAGIAPAGGIRASIGTMAKLTQALVNGSAPGSAALDPVADFARARIGAAWITLEHRGRAITWHNGGTGGFRSWLGIDRGSGTGLVLLSATSSSVDRHGFRLLGELAQEQPV